MQQVVTRYMKPMDKAKTPKTVFDNRELLFNNFRQIAEFHTTVLLEGIKYYAGEPRMLGRALLRMEREFDKHVAYCRDEPAAQRLLATDPHVNKYFQDLADDLGDDKGIAEHLKLPIQRINDYQLLLKELVKYSKRLNEDCTDLQKALELFLGVPNRATDNKFIASIEGYRGNIYKLGRLLTHDWFTILDSEGKAKERYLFLFKARILVCKVKRVSDDRSVFVLKDIIKLPEVEVKDHPEGNKFELHIPELTGPLVLTARKETVKTTWLEEIRQHSSDVVALAEHAADDLQLEEPEPEPEEKRKKREHEEDSAENKRVKVDVEEVLTREESLQQLKAKRKASIEKAEVAKKISKTELSEISAIHEVQEISSTVVTSEVTNKTSSDIEIKSSVTEVTTLESTQIEGQSRRQSDSTVDSVETVKIRESKVDQSALEENKFEQSSVEESKLERQYSVEEKKLEQSTAEENKVEQSSVEESKVELSSIEAIKVEQSSVEASKVEQSSIEASRITQSSLEKTKLSTEEQVSSLSTSQEQKSQESVRRKSEQGAEHISDQVEQQRRKSDLSLEQKSEQQFQQSSELISQQSIQQKSAKQSEQSFEQISQQSIQQKSEEIVQQVSTTEQKSEQLIQQTSEQTLQQASTKQQLSEQSVLQSSEQKSEHSVEQTSGSVRQETISEQKVSSEKTTVQSTVEQKTTRVIEETSSVTSSSVEKSSVQESVIASVTESQASKVESGQAREEAKEVEQTVTEGENGGDEMSRYNRSSRLSGDYSSARSGSRYESSSYESTGLSSTYSRRESGSRRESSKYESESSLEGVASSRYESSSKYESASAKLANGSSKYGIESSYSTNGGQIEGSANSYESYSSSKALANGSITTGESAAIRSKTESADGKPHFSVTLEGQNIEPGENAFFQCALSESSEKVKVTWLKDNRPFPDILMDRCTITTENGVHKMELLHCREDDTGVYTARAENVKGNTHCTAQLVVQTLTAEERRQKNALNMPYFLVALTDTEILENTYLRFMVKVKGDPNPDVTFFHDGKEIRASSAEKIDIIRTLADRGCYELVIADVTPAHAGTYSCKAINIYGDVTCDAKVTVVDDKNIFGELPPGGEGLLARGEKPAFTWKRDGEPFDPEERFKVLLGDDEDSLALVFQHVKPEDAGLYTCVAKTSTGNISCSAELTVQGAVNHLYREPEKPTLVIEHREAIASAGGSAMLELQCKGFPKPELQFKHDGKVIEADARHKFLYEDEESMSLVIKNVTSADAGVYEVLATNELGTDNTEIKLVVKAAPKIKQKIENQTCLMGESHTVTIEIEGTPTPEVSFFKDGVEIKASDRILIVKESEEVYKITIKDAKLTDTGSYSVVAKNEINQSSDFWQWQVVTPPKVLKKMGKEKIVEESETVTLEIKTEAEPAPEVKWFKNKVELVESSSVKFVSEGQAHSLVITSASRADAGEYSCEIRNTHGSVTDSSHVRVRAGPIFTERMTNKSAKEGDKNIEFTVSVEAYPEPTIKWYQGDVEITEKKSVFTRVDKGSSHKLILKEISAELSGTYKCKVTNELGEDSCEATFTVNRKPRITKSLVDMTVNAGQTLTLDVEVEGCPDPKVKWFKDGKEVNVDARIKIERDTQRLENYHLTVNLVKEEDGGEYEVRAENEMGSVSCKSTVTVHTKEIHSRLIEEVLENALDDEHQPKQGIVEELDTGTNQKALKGKTEAEIAEEKSFWDDDEDGNSKKTDIKEIEKPVSIQAQKSVTEPDIVEEKSFWDEIDEEPKKSNVKDVNTPQATKAKKSITEPEVAEEKSLWDENANEKKKAVQEEEILNNKQVGSKGLTEPETIENKSIEDDLSPKRKSVKKEKLVESLSAESEGKVFQTVTTFKTGDNGSIIASKVSSTRSHGAIITGPAETHTIHKMTSTSMCYEDTNEEDDDFGDYGGRKLIQPNVPHKTTLEVEEIASHSYYLTEMGHYSIPDFVRRGTYGIIEEPTDSEVDNNSRCGRQHTNRTISIMSVSEDESWQNEPLSREISIEDLSKSIFDIDDTKKVYSKDSYVRRTSFQEEYVAGDSEAFVVEEKTHQVFENDVTEKIKNISQEFDKGVIEIENKIEDIQNRIIEELVMRPMKNIENITKNETETTVEKRRNNRKLECVHEEDDEEIEALIRRSQRQRSILDDILTREDETKAPPSVKESNFKDKHVYESLPLVYTVEATGFPAPTVRWLHEGKEVKNGKRIKVTNEGDIFKLEIPSLEMEDGGKWQCEIINDVGKKVLKADLSVDSVNEFRKPIFTSPLEAQRALQREPATFRAVCTADPLPHVSWMLNGELLMPSASTKTTEESKETEHGLKECTYTLHIPSGHHTDTGEYTIQAKNQYGVGESSARLDIMLKPEIEGLADINAQPFEERSFVAVIHANPIAEVKWIKDGVQVLPSSSSNLEIVEDRLTETFKLTVKKVEIADGGVYTLTAKNELGETSKNATLSILTGEPVFTKPLQKQAVKDFDTCTLKVRADGVPKPDISWYREGELVTDDERHQVTTEVAGQVDSQLEIKEFCAGDAGKYMVRATNLVSEAVCEAIISLDQSTPGFTHKLERQKDVDEGEPILLTAKLQGSPRPTATWFKDGIEIPKTDPRITQVHLPDGTVKLSIEHAVPTDCGAYKLQISNPNGDYTALCAVAVNPTPRKPSFSQDLEDQKTTVGQPLKLQATIMAYPAPEVKWFKDGVPIRPSQAVNFINQPGGLIGLSIDACRPEDAGVYSLTVANKLGEVQSKATVEVSQREKKPAFIAELQPATVIEGFPARLEVKVLGHPPPTIKWTHNGKEIVPDGTHLQVISKPDGSQALLIDKATAADAGEYAVVAVNDKGEVASKAQLSVAGRTDDSVPQERPQLIHGLRDMTAEEGQPLALGAAYVGNPVPDVTWTKDGVPLVQADDVSIVCHGNRVGLEISPCAMSHAGVYSVKLVNPLGEDESSATVAVRKVYQPPSFSQKFTDLQQLPTFDAKFPARVQGVPAPDITWLKDGQPVREGEKYHIKRDGDAVCLYVRDVKPEDSGKYSCVARNREGEDSCAAQLEVVDTIRKRQKMEPPYFLKKIGDTEVYRGMSAKFTACAAGSPEPDVEWYRNGDRMFPCERIRMDKESTGLLRLTISQVEPTDVGTYTCRIYNDHGHAQCSSELTYDTLEPRENRKPIGDQYSDFDKMKKTGVPMPLADRPIIARMTDRHLTLGWKPSVPHGPRFPVTYQVEMCELPDGDWFTARTGLRSCVCDIRNLEPFRDYKFRIRVENKFGVSDPSPYATTHRSKLQPPAPRFVPYLPPGTDFRPDSSARFPQDFDIERPLHDGYSQAPGFLRQVDPQYGVKGHNVSLYWFVYGYPKPKMEYYFNDEKIEIGGRYDWSYTRNGQATLFINKMLERDIGFYEAVAINEHGQARQRVPLEIAEYPVFIKRPEETVVLERKNARIEARVTGVPYPDIKWYKDWQPLAESSRIKIKFIQPDTTILVINDAILKDEGLYSISASNVAGAVSSSAMLHIEESVEEYSYRIREHPPRIKASTKPFGDYYDLGDELGRGVQGVVYHAAERLSGRNYAAKIMHGHSELKPFMKNELEIMNMLNDRHLIRLHDAYEHDHTLALVMELAGGGELVRDKLLRSSLCTEREIAGYMRQLLRGLKYMHDNNVAHLGLTIGELLISHAGSDELKICDFGLSRRIQFGKHATLDYGVPEYVAPEVAAGEGVSYSADLWSVGIITYILLGGHSPFRGANDRETLSRIRQGRWDWHDEEWWSRFSVESRDFISKLLCYNVHERMDVNAALNHPWLTLADKIYEDEYQFTLDRLRNYYSLYREWMSNAQCRTWFRRRPLSGAFEHPSKMVYPPGEIYTPEGSPERDTHDRKGSPFDLKFKQWEHPDWEVSAKSESHYQNGPDTYLLQLRDTDFPVRLREYMKVACTRSVGYSLAVHDTYDPRTPIIRERRRFTDIMDEEIDDERRDRINNYGTESYTIRRLRHELGTRLDSYAEAQAFMESKKDGQLPFLREKPQLLPIREGEPAQLSCFAVGDPKPSVQWFKNDMVIAEGNRIKIIEDEEGRSTLRFEPAMHHDIGYYKVVARNKVGQTVARTRVVEACTPDAPDSPTAAETSDTEVLLRWKQPKYDGNSPVVCYGLQYKEGDSIEWKDVAHNIDHEFFVLRDLKPDTSYQFRLSSRNRIGWSDQGIPTHLVKTKAAGAPKLEITKAMKHLQQITESGQDIVLDEERPKLNYNTEESPIEWDSSENFTDKYSFISELWRGKFSIAVKGVDKSNNNVVVAKILENRPETEVMVKREYECIRRLRHERISNLIAAYQAPAAPIAALILEKLQGADILTYLSSRHDYTEQMVATIVTQILDGLQYIHWRGYCHLDLQPDNVVMSSVRTIQVKIIDFGSAHKVTKLGTSVPSVGELEYKAPEIINDEPAYPQTDIWSLGVLTYIMLSGVSPFRGEDDSETKQNISFVRYRFEHLYKEISQEATRFLMFLFKKVPLKRPSAEECHEHRWLTQSDFMNKKRERSVFLGNRLKEFSDEYHSRKSAEASQADTVGAAFGQVSPRQLIRSNSIQEELFTNFSSA